MTKRRYSKWIAGAVSLVSVGVAFFGVACGSGNNSGLAPVPTCSGCITLASNQCAQQAIAVNSGMVFWTTYTSNFCGDLYSIYADGEGQNTVGRSYDPYGMASDGINVFWANQVDYSIADPSGSVMMAPVQGGPATTLASGEEQPKAIVVDATNVYWTTTGDYPTYGGTIMQVAKSGGEPVTLVSGAYEPSAIVVDSVNVYWVQPSTSYTVNAGTTDATSAFNADGAILSVPIGGGATSTVASAQIGPSGLATDGTYVYFTTCGNPSTNNQGQVMKVPVGGGTPVAIGSGQVWGGPIAVDSAHVYWTSMVNGNGGIMVAALDGSAPAVLADNLGQPNALALDDSYVYWTDPQGMANLGYPLTGGTVEKIAKP